MSFSGCDEIVDECFRLTEPETHQRITEHWTANIPENLRKNFLFWKSLGADEIKRRRREVVKRELAKYDQTILVRAGLTLDDLVKARERKLAEMHAGRKLPSTPKRAAIRRTALRAIYRANKQVLDWPRAIEYVQAATLEEHGQEIDRKTIDSWLRCLHSADYVSITPPSVRGRGRPRKKE